jgi:hypothetical protein
VFVGMRTSRAPKIQSAALRDPMDMKISVLDQSPISEGSTGAMCCEIRWIWRGLQTMFLSGSVYVWPFGHRIA